MPVDTRIARLVGESEDAAREEVALYRRDPVRLPELELGAFEERPAGEANRLRLLLRLRLPPHALAPVERLRGEQFPFLRTYAFWHGARRALGDSELFRRLTQGTMILTYHAFGSPDEAAGRFVVPASRLDRQLRWLRKSRRPVIDLGELATFRREQRLPPAGAIAITIDDGYADNRAIAAPALRRFGLPATVYVVTGKLGGVNDWDRGELTGRRLLDWSDVEALAVDGISIGAHTRSHPQLPLLESSLATDEIAGSRADLEQRLGTAPETFAYPHGRLDDATVTLAREAGFSLACGVERGRNGPATPPHRLRRVEVDGRFSLAHFVRALALAR